MNPLVSIDLSGRWGFTPENGNKTTILVPGGGWLKQGFDCEAGIYETELEIPDIGRPAAITLELGAVNHIAEYFIGEDESSLKKIYEEVTAFTAQRVNVTPYVGQGGKYLLRIKVRAWENGRPVAPHWAEWCECIARGIFRGACLLIYPEIYISDIFVKTSVRKKELAVEVNVTNNSNYDARVSLCGALRSGDGGNWEYPNIEQASFTIKSNQSEWVKLPPVDWTLGEESFWRPNVPYAEGYRAKLHNLDISLKTDNRGGHAAPVRFGFRELWQENGVFILNGARINFRGDNLQVANYDRVDFCGKGDAIDTLPGFLPPSDTNPGWPKAVDNFLRLNYNVQREHMGPWTDYMVDICDEMGLMLIGESACRWNGFDMENDRGFHEVKCLRDIVKWHKNHPSIVRWSSKNEAQCMAPEYHLELYNAIKALDDTRPVFEDFIVGDRSAFDPDKVFMYVKDKDDFTYMEHYLSYNEKGEPYFSTIKINDAIAPLTGKPYGLTEADWMRSSTHAGLTYFAVTTALARAQGASDVRPYTLLSSWVSCVPGIGAPDLLTEENRHPVYGEDNAPDPWSIPGIKLLQKSCSPVFAMDYDFWRQNKDSNAWGHFPVTSPKIDALSTVTREITVFNDDLYGEDLLLKWELREGSVYNWIWDKGEMVLSIKPGYMEKINISFTAPKFNTYVFVTLRLYKDGRERFTDDLTCYEIVGGLDFSSEFNGEARVFK